MKPFVEEKREELLSRREQLLTEFSSTARADHDARLGAVFKDIQFLNEFIGSLTRIANEAISRSSSSVPRFAVSSLFLYESFRRLTADRDEQFVFITGTEIEGVRVLSQALEFEHDRRSVVGVTANPRATHRLLIKLEQFGHRLLAHFHSHPGNGITTIFPSGTDADFQRRLECAGHQALMAIFSRDGYIRFVRLDGNFEIEIFGEGVQKYGDNVYRLTNVDPA